MQAYQGSHRAPTDDGYSNPITSLAASFGPDVYTHPEFYGSGESDPETMRQLSIARDNPAATVRIYRALPPGLSTINRGDWITLSLQYGRRHSIQDASEKNDWPVIWADVPATTVFTDGNDLAEYGYDGPAVEGRVVGVDGGPGEIEPPVHGIWADRTPEYHAASQALIDGTARAKLAAGFAASGLTTVELAARVGHTERIARRVVAGDEMLGEGTVAAYFKAMGVKPDQAAVEAYRAEQDVLRRMAG
ncbi:hypothetical protein [Arthrobacter sp. STN4]|uniref:hypothetical protein n=1 Tax=Arthrobacter sp. STN4 TaxID=2923276 RepID=UPI00211A443B|nr:hypothetical protein [Arthrobacter sp. STN4]MCQ9162968.1 hypothetical protein [Arthrobacter sp. STN4]